MNTVQRTIVMGMALLLLAGTAAAASPVLREIEDAFIRLSEEVRPCVVEVRTKGTRQVSWAPFVPEDMDIFKFFFREPQQDERRRRTEGSASGFIYDNTGHVITSNHVVQDAEWIKVKLWDGEEFMAEVVGRDSESDLAVIKIDAKRDLDVAKLGDSAKLKVGQFAVAIGSAVGQRGSVMFGHISALDRESPGLQELGLSFQGLIQTDAPINLGNSGGPLCNIDGEVIGINVAVMPFAQSIGFAIPVNRVKEIVPELIAEGKVTRGYLGVRIVPAAGLAEGLGLPDENGAYVEDVVSGSPAEAAGIQVYDVIRKVNGEVVKDAADLMNKISAHMPGTAVMLEVWRDEKAIEVQIDLDERPVDAMAKTSGKTSLGLRVRPVPEDLAKRLELDPDQGVVVTEVEPYSPGDDARIAPGTVILEVARKRVSSVQDFHRLVQEYGTPGTSLLIRTVTQTGSPITRVVKIPEEE